jgi:hypothetical protein
LVGNIYKNVGRLKFWHIKSFWNSMRKMNKQTKINIKYLWDTYYACAIVTTMFTATYSLPSWNFKV